MKKIAIIGTNPDFLGGIATYQNKILSALIKRGFSPTLIYSGNDDKKYIKNGINFLEIKVPNIYPLDQISMNLKLGKIVRKENFDVINTHAVWGAGIPKTHRKFQIHTYHGTTYFFIKNHYSRLNFLKKVVTIPLLMYAYLIEKSPAIRAKKIICVSDKVLVELKELYGKIERSEIVRSGTNLHDFKPINKTRAKQNISLNRTNFYGLYVGRGGYWTKGLDRVVKLSEEIYRLNKNYRLIVGGADEKKVKSLINKPFIVYKPILDRTEISKYYGAAELFFCLSRYEGGAPTLVTGEAMACGCLVICSKDSKQEVIKDKENGLIINCEHANYKNEAKKILKLLENKKRKAVITANSIETIKKISEEWEEKYLEAMGL